MRKILIAAAAGLMTLTALPSAVGAATANTAQERPYTQDRDNRGRQDNNWNNGRDDRGRDDRDRGDRGRGDDRGRADDRYGRWDNNWGRRPDGPPRHWSRQNDWYRHVRACSQRYRSYDPRTDRYVVRRGQTALCRL